MSVEIKLSELKALVAQGRKREDIMEKYSLNNAQVTRLMKEAKLTFRKTHKPVFKLVDDLAVSDLPQTNEVVQDTNNIVDNRLVSEATTTSNDWGL